MKGTQTKRGAWFLVEHVNLGDGAFVRVWLNLTKDGQVRVRRYGARRVWSLPLADAAGLIARAVQLQAISRGGA